MGGYREEVIFSLLLQRDRDNLGETGKLCLGRRLPGKAFVNFTFPHFHVILLHFSTDS